MGRAFRELDPYEALAVAIAVETRNAERYGSFALMFEGYMEEASNLFLAMHDEELEHRKVLEEMYRARYGDRPYTVDEADVDEVVEAVDIEDAEDLVFDTMTRQKVLEAAMRAEKGAQQFYAVLSQTVQDLELLALYQQLGANEMDHIAALEKRMNSSGAERRA